MTSAVIVNRYQYTYDSANNRATMTQDGTETKHIVYSYDKNNRLLSETLISETTEIADTQTAVSETGNKKITTITETRVRTITEETIKTYTYDPNGNTLTVTSEDGVIGYTYNARNQQVSYLLNGATMASYTYNPDGLRRTKAVVTMLTQRYIWSGGSMVYECELLYPANGTVYVYGINLISARNSDGDNTFYLYNAHGDVVQLVDGTGTITQTYNYDAFGVEYDVDEDDDNHFRYAGQYYDTETGTYYLRARYYNPAIGRLTTEDPISAGLNWYTYCGNNPVIFIDPSGLIPTASEAADMAKHIYDPTNEDLTLSGGWVYESSIFGGEGMVMGVYSRVNADGDKEYALVNKGSSTLSDWVNNVEQPFGNSDDMIASIEAAILFVTKHEGYEVTMVGHSKGGAEAAANAVATGTNCIVFNPATVFLEEYEGTRGKNYTASMTAYIVEGEILNIIFGPISTPIGTVVYLPSQHNTHTLKGSPLAVYIANKISDALNNHSMDSLIKALKQHQLTFNGGGGFGFVRRAFF